MWAAHEDSAEDGEVGLVPPPDGVDLDAHTAREPALKRLPELVLGQGPRERVPRGEVGFNAVEEDLPLGTVPAARIVGQCEVEGEELRCCEPRDGGAR